jgi:hypothetical protein
MWTPLSRFLIEKLPVAQLVKKIHLLYGPRRFITVYTTAHQWSFLRHMNPAHRPTTHFLKSNLNYILSRTRKFMLMVLLFMLSINDTSHACYTPRPPNPSAFNHCNYLVKSTNYAAAPLRNFPNSPVSYSLVKSKSSSQSRVPFIYLTIFLAV